MAVLDHSPGRDLRDRDIERAAAALSASVNPGQTETAPPDAALMQGTVLVERVAKDLFAPDWPCATSLMCLWNRSLRIWSRSAR